MANKPSQAVGGAAGTERGGQQAQHVAPTAPPGGQGELDRIATGLVAVLADTYVSYFLAQKAHWNVEGENFYGLHKLFEEQYEKLSDALDDIAEQLRSIGHRTPSSFEELLRASKVRQEARSRGDRDFVRELLEAHLTTLSRIREVLPLTNGELHSGTNDLLVERVREHEKAIWMLRATLGEQGRAAA